MFTRGMRWNHFSRPPIFKSHIMRLRKYIAILFLSAFMFHTGAVTAQSDDLESIVRLLNAEMPMSLGMVGDMTEIAIRQGCLEFTATVDDDLINIEALKANPELLKESMQQMFLNKNKDGNMKILMDELIPANLGLKLTYIGKSSGMRVSATMSAKELKGLYESKDVDNPDALLDAQIRVTNAQLPKDLGDGMVNTKLVREGDCIVYYYECDEDIYDIDQMNEVLPMLKELVISEINDNNDPTISLLRQICKNANVGIAFTYQGKTSGKKATIKVPSNELK